ncbi:hypothetical protein DEF28_05690 [Marinitenerispora sediminis]|uniref:Uncharacterized protein n=1 Tax=Marinitenerispora sediminis TaxID=1931232 RepID=A0A368T0I7_9ACTN|nr:hypothetical protein DEF24_21520 [Marinitenerispora sediminis]RCV55587.1 hypothetical protein DEF28_05690 [Marinitenerispora sediminis]
MAASCLILLTGCGGGSLDSRAPGPGHHTAPSTSPGAPSTPPASPGTAPGGHPAESGGEGSEVYVYNLFRREQGREDREPEGLTASEFTTFTALEWDSWGADSATASGELRGTWCLPGCQNEPYQVTVVLSEPRTVDDTAFFSRYEVIEAPGMPEDQRELLRQVDGGRLMLPEDGSGPPADGPS